VNRNRAADVMTSDEVEYLPRDTPSEGRGEVRIKIKKKDQGKLKCSVNRNRAATALTSNKVEYFPRNTPTEVGGEVSEKKKD
jgi:hypothetical protein